MIFLMISLVILGGVYVCTQDIEPQRRIRVLLFGVALYAGILLQVYS